MDRKDLERRRKEKRKEHIVVSLIGIVVILISLALFYLLAYKIPKKIKTSRIDSYTEDSKLLEDEDILSKVEDPILSETYAEYGLYLINNNDNLIDLEVEATDIYEDFIKHYKDKKDKASNYEKELDLARFKIEDIIYKHTEILKDMDNTSPNEDTLDYKEIYDKIMEGHLYMSQGMIMQLEHLYNLNNSKLGEDADALLNIAGNVILEFGPIVNEVRDTNHLIRYRAKEDKPIIKEEFREEYEKMLNGLADKYDKYDLEDVDEHISDVDKEGNINIDLEDE